MKREWVLSIKEQCEAQGVAFFFKQWGTWGEDMVKRSKKVNGRVLLGQTWDAYPKANSQHRGHRHSPADQIALAEADQRRD